MSKENHHVQTNGHGDYERRDIGIAGVLYFLVGLAAACALVYFVVDGLYAYLDKRAETNQPPLSPMITNAPNDTRHIPRDYPRTVFPSPKLEEDERGQLDEIRLQEEDTLSTYGWVDQKAGTVRIPIDRAMDLLAQRGLPVRSQAPDAAAASSQQSKAEQPTAAEQSSAQQKKGSSKKK